MAVVLCLLTLSCCYPTNRLQSLQSCLKKWSSWSGQRLVHQKRDVKPNSLQTTPLQVWYSGYSSQIQSEFQIVIVMYSCVRNICHTLNFLTGSVLSQCCPTAWSRIYWWTLWYKAKRRIIHYQMTTAMTSVSDNRFCVLWLSWIQRPSMVFACIFQIIVA